MNYFLIYPTPKSRIERIKEVALDPKNIDFMWSNYDILSLIKKLEEIKEKVNE